MENFFYEIRPAAYALISFYALVVSRNSTLMIASGTLLAFCCLSITLMRFQYRRSLAAVNRQVEEHARISEKKHYQNKNKYEID